MQQVSAGKASASSRSRAVAICGVTVALMAVSAWVTVPIGPVPVTLQIFVMVFALLALPARQAVASVAVYLLMGAVGLPMFSSMRGGIGVLAGYTGGFIWGFLAGMVVGAAILAAARKAGLMAAAGERPKRSAVEFAICLLAGVALTAVCYLCGWAQLVLLAGMTPEAAFATGIAPFVLIDAAKVVAATVVAQAVRRALR